MFLAGGYGGNSDSEGAASACSSWRALTINTTRSAGTIEGFVVGGGGVFCGGMAVIHSQKVLLWRVLRGVPLLRQYHQVRWRVL